MKNILFILLFISSYSHAQTYIGASKKDLIKKLKEVNVKVKDTITANVNWLQFPDNGKMITTYMAKDTVQYFTILSPLSEINERIASFNAAKFERPEKLKWIDLSDKKYHELVYEIRKFNDGFLLIISVGQ